MHLNIYSKLSFFLVRFIIHCYPATKQSSAPNFTDSCHPSFVPKHLKIARKWRLVLWGSARAISSSESSSFSFPYLFDSLLNLRFTGIRSSSSLSSLNSTVQPIAELKLPFSTIRHSLSIIWNTQRCDDAPHAQAKLILMILGYEGVTALD